MAPPTASRPRSALKAAATAPARVHPVWWLNLAICTSAGLLIALAVAAYRPIAAPHMPWWLLAVLIALCERWPVKQFQRSAH